MKKIFSFFLLSLMTSLFFAQSDNYKSMADRFQSDYNSGNYDAIYNSFSAEMKTALPLEDTKQFLSGLKLQLGKIESKEFVTMEQTYAVYKTKFEKAVFAVNISLDQQNRINGLFVKPYEEKNKADGNNKTVNALHGFPKSISDAVFSSAKDFPDNTQISIAFIQNGKTQFYGITKQNDTVKSIKNQNKVFEIGSVTKAFTVTVLASLVQDKKISLNDNINSYFSFPFKDKIKLNFQSLANHTSGLPRLPDNLDLSNESNPYKNYGKKEIEDYLKNNLKLESNSSTKYEYSNLGAGLLGYTLGLSQKTTFQQLLQKRIFDRYNMKDSFTSSENLKDKLVSGINANGEKIPNWDFDVLFGGGGILSTAEDLSKFIEAQFNIKNAELALTRKPTFTINDKMKIGLGWHILKNKNSNEFLWHNGGTAGYSSSLAFNAENKNAVIILSNVSAFNPKMENIDNLCFELMDLTNKK
ncbi:penicillin-binding protein [Chryseobacterium formosense]|uniref:Penicillin-binding protein n=1 Tax=Chryseobacterium formosense TaxID=236814 RepID=A0A085Z7C1_9FLAO|nr:serine hydrolase [Chryseobacterium formosense]KFF00335.1 penicillin-binding protein [Chryseobacterium formosense]SFT32965.1 CubicO group peptidase, beta-lactamase class C family [Chryseobacterium formosense]